MKNRIRRVALLIESSRNYGRGVLRGVARYAQVNGPWSFFTVTPAAGKHFGMALNSSDDDAPGTAIQQSMSSSVATRKLLDPTSWGTVQLDP